MAADEKNSSAAGSAEPARRPVVEAFSLLRPARALCGGRAPREPAQWFCFRQPRCESASGRLRCEDASEAEGSDFPELLFRGPRRRIPGLLGSRGAVPL